MPIRFLDSNFFKSPFVRGLSGQSKLLYGFIICECTPAGIWCKDIEAASLYCGFKYDEETFQKDFIENGKAINIGNGKFFFPDFIEHQYPQGLSSENNAHKNAITELKKLDKIVEREIDKKGKKVVVFFLKQRGAEEGLTSPTGGAAKLPKTCYSNSNSISNSHSNSKELAKTQNLIVPKIAEVYMSFNKEAFVDVDLDYPAALEIAKKIKKWKNIKPDVTEAVVEVCEEFRKICSTCSNYEHYSSYSLQMMNKHFSTIIKLNPNGREANKRNSTRLREIDGSGGY